MGFPLLVQVVRASRVARLVNPGLIAVVRAPQAEAVGKLARALFSGGVEAIEITTSTPEFTEAIRLARAELGSDGIVGAGTILTAAQANAALEAGAEFLVSPVLLPELIEIAHGAGAPIALGAYTPTECYRAHHAGADFVKLFPADGLGTAYIKALRAPMPQLPLIPTGGISVENVASFFEVGCRAVGIGGNLVRNEWIVEGRWDELQQTAAAFRKASQR
jgi:2-dehydro-3-deoxyphosphogluconate aldolase/(4S)-4-hydroxy-2-oxoglutarate aldolase